MALGQQAELHRRRAYPARGHSLNWWNMSEAPTAFLHSIRVQDVLKGNTRPLNDFVHSWLVEVGVSLHRLWYKARRAERFVAGFGSLAQH